MTKNNWALSGILVLACSAGIFNLPFLWVLSLISIITFYEWKLHKVNDLIAHKEKIMGNRVIEGMKALTELCGNAFDHIKDNKQKTDKLNAKIGEHTARLHRLDQQKHRLDSGRASERRNKERYSETERAARTSASAKESFRRTPNRDKSVPKTMPEAAGGPGQNSG